VLRIIESYHLQFIGFNHLYLTQYLPLAIKFFTDHFTDRDLMMVHQ
jgi:hypothetical protein